jgi:cytochrome c-type biogenesis protein CcmH/NrfG
MKWMTAAEHFSQGCTHAEQGELTAAFDHLERSVRLEPDNAAACKLLARLSLSVDEVRAFVCWCHEAARIDPRDPEPHLMMAEVFERTNRLREAAEARYRATSLTQPSEAR